jgi:hypothetical protein
MEEATMNVHIIALIGAALASAVGPANATINLTYTITLTVVGNPPVVFQSPPTGVPMGPPPVNGSDHPGVYYSLLTTPTGADSWHLALSIDCGGFQCSIASWSPDLYDTDLKHEVPILVTGYDPSWTPDWSNPLKPVFYASPLLPPVDPYSVSANIAAVPEPSTWMTLLVGFGAMGALSRRAAKARRWVLC